MFGVRAALTPAALSRWQSRFNLGAECPVFVYCFALFVDLHHFTMCTCGFATRAIYLSVHPSIHSLTDTHTDMNV